MILLMGLGAFRIRFGTFQNWQGHVFSLGAPPQLSEAPLLRWYSGTLPSSDPSWLWKRRTWEVADVPINAGRSPVSARAAEPESCASTQGNLRGGRSPHTSWLPRADLGCLPTVRDSQAQPQALSPRDLGVGGVVPQRGAILLYLSTFLFKTPQRRLVSNSKVPRCHKLHLHHQGLSLGHQLTSQGSHHS